MQFGNNEWLPDYNWGKTAPSNIQTSVSLESTAHLKEPRKLKISENTEDKFKRAL
jgi:hypothetical protein